MSELAHATARRSKRLPSASGIVELVAPYDETSYLTSVPGGERLRRGCFAKSIQERGDRIPLCIGHVKPPTRPPWANRRAGKTRPMVSWPRSKCAPVTTATKCWPTRTMDICRRSR